MRSVLPTLLLRHRSARYVHEKKKRDISCSLLLRLCRNATAIALHTSVRLFVGFLSFASVFYCSYRYIDLPTVCFFLKSRIENKQKTTKTLYPPPPPPKLKREERESLFLAVPSFHQPSSKLFGVFVLSPRRVC